MPIWYFCGHWQEIDKRVMFEIFETIISAKAHRFQQAPSFPSSSLWTKNLLVPKFLKIQCNNCWSRFDVNLNRHFAPETHIKMSCQTLDVGKLQACCFEMRRYFAVEIFVNSLCQRPCSTKSNTKIYNCKGSLRKDEEVLMAKEKHGSPMRIAWQT